MLVTRAQMDRGRSLFKGRYLGLIQLPLGTNAWLRAAKESVRLLFGLGNQ